MIPRLFVIGLGVTALSLSPPLRAADGTWNQPLGGDWTLPANWLDEVVPSAGADAAWFNAVDIEGTTTVLLSGTDNTRVGNLTFGDTGLDTAGSWQVQGGAFVIRNRTVAVESSVRNVAIQSNWLGGNLSLNIAAGSRLELGGTISGTGSLELVDSPGLAILSGSNDFTGDVKVTRSWLRVTSSESLGIPASGKNLTLLNGRLEMVGDTGLNFSRVLVNSTHSSNTDSTIYLDRATEGSGVGYSFSGFSGGRMLTIRKGDKVTSGVASLNIGVATMDQITTFVPETGTRLVISSVTGAFQPTFSGTGEIEIDTIDTTNTNGIIKSGSGTLTLGSLGTYTGTTSLMGGQVILNRSQGGVHGSSSNLLAMAGGSLYLKGASDADTQQVLGNLNLSQSSHNRLIVEKTGDWNTTLVLGDAWTFSSGSGTLFVDLSGGGALQSSPDLTNGILGYAVLRDNTGTWFATVSDNGYLEGFKDYTDAGLESASNSATTNFTISGSLALAAGTHQTNSLRIDTSPGEGTLDLSGTHLQVTTNALLVTGSHDFIIRNGRLGNDGAVMIHHYGTGTLTIDATLSYEGGAGIIKKDGAGMLVLAGANQGTGGLSISEGTVGISSNDNITAGGTGDLILDGGTLLAMETFTLRNEETSRNRPVGIGDNGGTLEVAEGKTLTVTGVISNQGSAPGILVKTGEGGLVLTNANTFSGVTRVRQGVLAVSGGGSLAASSRTHVETGATLTGDGAVGDLVVYSGGVLSPGNSPGTLSAGTTTLMGGGIYHLELASDGTGGSAGVDWDQLAITGMLDLSLLSSSDPFIISLHTLGEDLTDGALATWDPGVDHLWSSVITATNGFGGEVSPSLFQINTESFINGFNGQFQFALNANQTGLDLVYMAIPEPRTWLISVVGGLVLLLRVRKGRRNA